jgi:hypothetical protein
MKKIMILLIILISSFTKLNAQVNGHCFCVHRHIISVSACSQFNFGKNWSNGFALTHSFKGFYYSHFELAIQSSRIGSSLFSDNRNQDIITLGYSNSEIFRNIFWSLYGTINIGYVNTEGDNSKNFLKSNLILATELGFTQGKVDFKIGYNVFNSFYLNKNVAPFYINIGIHLRTIFYCKSIESYDCY